MAAAPLDPATPPGDPAATVDAASNPVKAVSELSEAIAAGLVDPLLLERAGSFARGARTDSTWEAYDRDMTRFVAWCTQRANTMSSIVYSPPIGTHAIRWTRDELQ